MRHEVIEEQGRVLHQHTHTHILWHNPWSSIRHLLLHLSFAFMSQPLQQKVMCPIELCTMKLWLVALKKVFLDSSVEEVV